MLPLLKTRWLCKKDRKRVLLTMERRRRRTPKCVIRRAARTCLRAAATRRNAGNTTSASVTGTMSRTGATCPWCRAIMTMEDIRLEGRAGRLGTVMTAVVVDGPRGKEYRLPTEHERCGLRK